MNIFVAGSSWCTCSMLLIAEPRLFLAFRCCAGVKFKVSGFRVLKVFGLSMFSVTVLGALRLCCPSFMSHIMDAIFSWKHPP